MGGDGVTYPYRNPDGVMVWACCLSEIGPVCQHRSGVAIRVVHQYAELTHRVVADVTGAEPFTIQTGTWPLTERQFTPEQVSVRYDWRTHIGAWWSVSSIEISGPWVGEEERTGTGMALLYTAIAPEWVQQFVAEHEPKYRPNGIGT